MAKKPLVDWNITDPMSLQYIANKPFGPYVEETVKTFETKYNQNVGYIFTVWNPAKDRIDQISYRGHTYDCSIEELGDTYIHLTYTPHEGGIGRVFIQFEEEYKDEDGNMIDALFNTVIVYGQYRPMPGVKVYHEINLRAIWEKAPELNQEGEFTLTLLPNGGALGPYSQYKFNTGDNYDDVIIDYLEPARRGYYFDGWVDEDDNYVDIEDALQSDRNITLKATWYKEDEYDKEENTPIKDGTMKVNYFYNGGHIRLSHLYYSQTKYVNKAELFWPGSKDEFIENRPRRTGYNFVRWEDKELDFIVDADNCEEVITLVGHPITVQLIKKEEKVKKISAKNDIDFEGSLIQKQVLNRTTTSDVKRIIAEENEKAENNKWEFINETYGTPTLLCLTDQNGQPFYLKEAVIYVKAINYSGTTFTPSIYASNSQAPTTLDCWLRHEGVAIPGTDMCFQGQILPKEPLYKVHSTITSGDFHKAVNDPKNINENAGIFHITSDIGHIGVMIEELAAGTATADLIVIHIWGVRA